MAWYCEELPKEDLFIIVFDWIVPYVQHADYFSFPLREYAGLVIPEMTLFTTVFIFHEN